jgi:hypothetical protein
MLGSTGPGPRSDDADAGRGLDDAEGADDDDDDAKGAVSGDIDNDGDLLPPIFLARFFRFPGARKTSGARADVAGSG